MNYYFVISTATCTVKKLFSIQNKSSIYSIMPKKIILQIYIHSNKIPQTLKKKHVKKKNYRFLWHLKKNSTDS